MHERKTLFLKFSTFRGNVIFQVFFKERKKNLLNKIFFPWGKTILKFFHLKVNLSFFFFLI